MRKLTPASTKIPVFDPEQNDWSCGPPLVPTFFSRDPRQVAPELLGKILLRRKGHSLRAGRIVEVEAYLGAEDAAAHAAAGETARNRVLFGPPGHAYIYLSYGLHFCLNVSCMPPGQAGCVLFRALQPLAGIQALAWARGMEAQSTMDLRKLCNGPARLCQAMEITREKDNGRDLTLASSGLWITGDGFQPKQIARSTRVGITKSADLPLRFYIKDNEYISACRMRES